jgi:hypothetical protein
MHEGGLRKLKENLVANVSPGGVGRGSVPAKLFNNKNKKADN